MKGSAPVLSVGCALCVIIGEVLVLRWKSVPLYARQQFLQLHEELFARQVSVGIHVPAHAHFFCGLFEQPRVGRREQCGARHGYGFVSGREHGPAVGASLRDVDVFFRLCHAEHGQVVYAALAALREAELGLLRCVVAAVRYGEVAVLHANEFAVCAVEWCLQPWRAVSAGP